MSACISTPISWLRLEQHAIGEGADGTEELATHLLACPVCRACFAAIEEGARTELMPLPAPPTARAPKHRSGRALAISIGSGLALAAAAILGFGRWSRVEGGNGGTSERIKGDALAFTLVRSDDARFPEATGAFRDGDAFKVLVTCSPGVPAHANFEIVVLDGAGASFPLQPAAAFECGNDVPLPGAFRITGNESVRVCLMGGESPLDRKQLARLDYDTITARGACKVLAPAR